MGSVSTISFFRFKGAGRKFWALRQMQFAKPILNKVSGLMFYKLLGTGKQGFSTSPDWEVFSLLQHWESLGDAENFFGQHQWLQKYRDRSDENWTLFMRPLRSKGLWNGKNPFDSKTSETTSISMLAVITRATIKRQYLWKFWNSVPASRETLEQREGLLYTKGIGETPFIHMATFSLWKDVQSMMDFAYSADGHQQAIRRTRELGWYSEELFARFQPFKMLGNWSDCKGMELLRQELSTEKT